MKKILKLTESDLVRLVKKIINEQETTSFYKVGETYSATRSVDGKQYTIKVIKVGQNGWIYGYVIGPGTYEGKNLKNGIKLELSTDSQNELSGNRELGKFTNLKKIKYEPEFPTLPKERSSTENTRVSKPTILDLSRQSKLKECKAKYGKPMLKKAVDWWVSWLRDPITKTKFKKNWKLSDSEVNEIFQDYMEALNDIEIVYGFEKGTDLAHVSGTNVFGFQPLGEKNVIYINCNLENSDTIGLLIHEIQHLLFYVKPLHPEQKIQQDLKFDPSNKKSIWDRLSYVLGLEDKSKKENITSKKSFDNVKQKLKSFGLDDFTINYYFGSYIYELKRNPRYIESETELLSRLSHLRRALKLKPGQDISVDDFIKLAKKGNLDVYWTMMNIIHTDRTLKEVLDIFNTYAKANTGNKEISSEV